MRFFLLCIFFLNSSECYAEVVGIWKVEKHGGMPERVYGKKKMTEKIPEFTPFPGDDAQYYYWCFFLVKNHNSKVVSIWFPLPVRNERLEVRLSRKKTIFYNNPVRLEELVPSLNKLIRDVVRKDE